ncbi:phosphatase PAP2 family protein [Candidatus Woesearchaeota archaeon]|nr:phosphatase PAP2 family protein [Candidatus Woesearchaeota archaeon]
MENANTLFKLVSWLGLPPAYAVVVIFLWKTGWPLANKLGLALLVIEALTAMIKFIYHKDRPVKMPRRNLLEKYEAGGFPSIHSARTAAVAIGLGLAYQYWLIWLAAAATVALVGYSRIYLKKHDAIDVFGGIAIAVVISALSLGL